MYGKLIKCRSKKSRDDMIKKMSDDERSAVLLYAVYEKGTDNSELITAVAQNFNGQLLTGDYQSQFTNLKFNDELDSDNYAALINSDTPLGTMIRNVLGG